jgi:ABC-type uncharacterized transport system permease subunit
MIQRLKRPADTASEAECFEHATFETHLRDAGAFLAPAAAWYWITEMQARYILGQHAEAAHAADRAGLLMPVIRHFPDIGEYHL